MRLLSALQFCLYHCLGTLSHFKHFRKSPVQVLLIHKSSESHTSKEGNVNYQTNKIKSFKKHTEMWFLYWVRGSGFNQWLTDLLFGVFSATCFLWCFYTEKKWKTYCFIQFSLRTMIWVTIAILDAAWMTYNGDIFHNHDKKKSNTALNSIAERQRYPASMADKQSSFPELNAALRHILILYSKAQNPFHYQHST